MAMRATTIRFSPMMYEEIAREAAREGMTTAQFIREAAILRLGYIRARRGEEISFERLGYQRIAPAGAGP